MPEPLTELEAAGLLPEEVEWVREVAPGIHRDRALAAINALAARLLELLGENERLNDALTLVIVEMHDGLAGFEDGLSEAEIAEFKAAAMLNAAHPTEPTP